jgi:protoporphyrinogen oxidase
MEPKQAVYAREADELQYRALLFVYVFLDKPFVGDDHWIYFPEEQFIFNRVSEPRTFSPSHTPPGKTSLCTEITCDIGDHIWNLPAEKLTAIVVSQLEACGLISSRDVFGSFTHRLRFGYPIYTLGYKKRLDSILEFTGMIENLTTGGRQGTFNYSNMSDAIVNGIENAKQLQTN